MPCDTGSDASNAITFNQHIATPVQGRSTAGRRHVIKDTATTAPSPGAPIHIVSIPQVAVRQDIRSGDFYTTDEPATDPSADDEAVIVKPRRPRRKHTGARRRGHRGPAPHLSKPTMDDLDDLHTLFADPRIWWNMPNHRHTSIDQTQTMLEHWIHDWQRHGIGYWVMRDHSGHFLGTGGIRRAGDILNMRYYIPPRLWHLRYGSYLAASGQKIAAQYDAALPIFLAALARNYASCMIADKLGFVVVRRDVDFTADAASRRIYADRAVRQQDIDNYLSLRETV